jgi:hypothetical protein
MATACWQPVSHAPSQGLHLHPLPWGCATLRPALVNAPQFGSADRHKSSAGGGLHHAGRKLPGMLAGATWMIHGP